MFRATHGTRLISPVPAAAVGTCNIAIIIQRVLLNFFYVPTHPPHMNYMSWAVAQLKELRNARNYGKCTKGTNYIDSKFKVPS